MSALKFAACCGATAPLYVDDVFSAYTRTGTGASATVTTGIDLSTYGGCVWVKSRSAATGHRLRFTAIGAGTELITDTTGASSAATQGVTSFSTTGHVIGTDTDYNNSTGPATYVDWTFRNAPNFYHHDTVVKSAGSNATYNFSMHTAGLGMVRVKRTDVAGSWYIWHRSLTAGKLLIGETTAAAATLGHITVSGTTVTLVNGVIADGTYLVEAWAHDTSAEGIIQCGSFTCAGGALTLQNIGWEPQLLELKNITYAESYSVYDTARGWPSDGTVQNLVPNTSAAEITNTGRPNLVANGFGPGVMGGAFTYIYLAIRRPNKPPTSGAQVYNAIARIGTGAAATVTGVGFAPDLVIAGDRNTARGHGFGDRLRGSKLTLRSWETGAEASDTEGITSFNMEGVSLGTGSTHGGNFNVNAETYINHFFRRAPGFFDVVCYTGTGANKTETHNLTVAPELWIVKGRSGATAWTVGCTALANTEYLVLNTTATKATDATAWNSTFPTASVFSLGTRATVNTNAATYVAYLFASLAGISKVGSYTGDGTTGKAIPCGFAAGARFILIKRTDSTGDWFVFDSVRTYPAGNDYHLSLNTTVAEVLTTDDVDYDAAGFLVNQNATTNLNVTSATYIFLAIA